MHMTVSLSQDRGQVERTNSICKAITFYSPYPANTKRLCRATLFKFSLWPTSRNNKIAYDTKSSKKINDQSLFFVLQCQRKMKWGRSWVESTELRLSELPSCRGKRDHFPSLKDSSALCCLFGAKCFQTFFINHGQTFVTQTSMSRLVPQSRLLIHSNDCYWDWSK